VWESNDLGSSVKTYPVKAVGDISTMPCQTDRTNLFSPTPQDLFFFPWPPALAGAMPPVLPWSACPPPPIWSSQIHVLSFSPTSPNPIAVNPVSSSFHQSRRPQPHIHGAGWPVLDTATPIAPSSPRLCWPPPLPALSHHLIPTSLLLIFSRCVGGKGFRRKGCMDEETTPGGGGREGLTTATSSAFFHCLHAIRCSFFSPFFTSWFSVSHD
jgi:hypothetical protein